ncbi:MAG TPA: aminotransferase class IV [Bryobacteraceae bacterium]|nr:aminotransferase class IV [Bryobacteraceae bacterium]
MAFVLHRFVLHNDTIRPAGEPLLRAGQIGLLSGWGVFSTLRVVNGVPFAFERHWARMMRDAAALHVPVPREPEAIRRKLVELIEANQAFEHTTLRLVIVRNGGGMWEGPPAGAASDVIAMTANSKDWGDSVKLGYVPNARHAACEFTGTKILSWAANLTWVERAQARGLDEVVLLNERGEVAECTSANIFVANNNQVWTPPLASGCLPGITREILLEEIRVAGIGIGEETLYPADLEAADEVFITSTTRNLLPVSEIEGKRVGGSRQVSLALETAFTEFVDRYGAAHRQVPVPAGVSSKEKGSK